MKWLEIGKKIEYTKVKTPASTAYDYYNPEQVGVAQPEVVAVE